MIYTLAQLAERVGGVVRGDPQITIGGISSPDQAGPGDLVFATDAQWLERALASAAAAILVAEAAESTKPLLVVEEVRWALRTLLPLFEGSYRPEPGVHPLSYVAPGAELAEDVRVGAFACVMAGARLERGVILHAYAYVGEDCVVGEETELFPRATLMPRTKVGKRCRLHSGCVIGDAGFGYHFEGGMHHRVPQVGHVEIEDDCDIGANVTIDRAMVGFTLVGRGTKIDNLVQIAHNVRIGPNCIIVAQTGLSGSVKIGEGVVLGGQTGVVEHVEIASGVRTGGQTGVAASIREPGDYWGTPARPMRKTLQTMAAASRAAELVREVRELRKRVEELERRSG